MGSVSIHADVFEYVPSPTSIHCEAGRRVFTVPTINTPLPVDTMVLAKTSSGAGGWDKRLTLVVKGREIINS